MDWITRKIWIQILLQMERKRVLFLLKKKTVFKTKQPRKWSKKIEIVSDNKGKELYKKLFVD